MKENWLIKPVDSERISQLSQQCLLDPAIVTLLYRRGYTEEPEILHFINPSYASLHSPFLMLNMYDAVELLRAAVAGNKKIGIFSDSDLDGLTSLYIVKYLLDKMGIDIFYYYPNKDHSDYGLTNDVVQIFIDQKIDLLITLDCGIRDVEPVATLRTNNIDVLVCDHHEPDAQLPDAVIVNPKQHECPYPFNELAGVGVAFKLCQAFLLSYLPVFGKRSALLMNLDDKYIIRFFVDGIELADERVCFYYIQEMKRYTAEDDIVFHYNLNEQERGELDGRICHRLEDVVIQAYGTNKWQQKFRDHFTLHRNSKDGAENALVNLFKESLFLIPAKVGDFINNVMPYIALGSIADVVPLQNENRVLTAKGIEQFNICESSTFKQLKQYCNSIITSKVIGWQVAPLLNSPGRFGKTGLTAGFILGTDNNQTLLTEITSLNEYRKEYVKTIYSDILKNSHRAFYDDAVVYVVCESIEEGVSGLLASRLVDHYQKPAIVVVKTAEGFYKGSGRSPVSGFYSLLEPYCEIFERFGGHDQALGFTIQKEKLDKFESIVRGLKLNEDQKNRALLIDLEIDISDVDFDYIKRFNCLEPFGSDHQLPVYLSREVYFTGIKIFGRGREHGKLLTDNKNVEILSWNGAQSIQQLYDAGSADIVYNMELNSYLGAQSIRMMLLDSKFV
ncbi:MAG: single-stranded-DNA-specific exonuclease RecJ [Spirochaetes bacterium]|jgi:single-stranded-DNA-specific exonuclease|nr:single-stranded-DNA-specific exonuclease RecJ [Spirochaetota bacterium]